MSFVRPPSVESLPREWGLDDSCIATEKAAPSLTFLVKDGARCCRGLGFEEHGPRYPRSKNLVEDRFVVPTFAKNARMGSLRLGHPWSRSARAGQPPECIRDSIGKLQKLQTGT